MFLPDARYGATLDRRMRDSLADSIEHVFEAAASKLGLAELDAEKTCADIRAHRLVPGIFGRYYDLVFALKRGQFDEARTLLREIAALASLKPDLSVVPLTEAALTSDASRFTRLLSGERAGKISFGPPDAPDWNGFETKALEALKQLDVVDAQLAAEVRDLVIQIVGAAPAREGDDFGSASSLMLWGAVVVNLRRHDSVLEIMDAVVHEAAHLHLFGLSIDEPLVTNPIKERYSSPLRTDARPMDGIFHATFVCARLFHLYTRIDAVQPDGLEVSGLETRLQELHRRFRDGRETIERHGRLTPTGKRVLADASDYMKRAA